MNYKYMPAQRLQKKERQFLTYGLRYSWLVLCVLVTACSSPNKTASEGAVSTLANQAVVSKSDTFTVQLLGINDFHGQILPVENLGGMHHLSHHLLSAIESTDEHTFILHAGDHVGASPAESALLQDEPAIDFLNILQNNCNIQRDKTCHIIGTAGNHEFDEGSDEMLRLLNGGNHTNGPFIHAPWTGTNYQTVSANVTYNKSQQLLLEPYAIHQVNNVPIGFIGITLDITPELVIPGMVDNLEFKNQSEAVSHYVDELQRKGIESIVVIVHDGTTADYYDGDTQDDAVIPTDSRFGRFLKQLPDAVDVIVSGHSHRFTNAYVENKNGKKLLVTQAFSSGRAYADISIKINRETRDIVESSAEVIYANVDIKRKLSSKSADSLKKISKLVSNANEYAKEYTRTVINTYEPMADEITLGHFIADAHQYALKSDCAIMNNGGVRAQMERGKVTWGDLFAIQPFGNALVERRYSGEQLMSLITGEHFWSRGVVIDSDGQITLDGKAIETDHDYTVGGNAYIMNSEQFSVGELVKIEGVDIEKTVDYVKSLPTPFSLSDTPTTPQ